MNPLERKIMINAALAFGGKNAPDTSGDTLYRVLFRRTRMHQVVLGITIRKEFER